MLKTKEEIENWLDQHDIKEYTINDDLTVDVARSVFLFYDNLTEIPIQFGVINGGFFCTNNKLKSLKGSPYIVNGSFHCQNNELINLDYCPKIITENFICSDNPIKNIKNFNSKIDGDFIHTYMPDKKWQIKELKDFYEKVENHLQVAVVISGKDLTKLLSYIKLKKEVIGEVDILKEKNKFKL
jgi:hypothetical protein